jgi:hypothetical protein
MKKGERTTAYNNIDAFLYCPIFLYYNAIRTAIKPAFFHFSFLLAT